MPPFVSHSIVATATAKIRLERGVEMSQVSQATLLVTRIAIGNYPGCIRQIDELVATGSIQEVYTIDV